MDGGEYPGLLEQCAMCDRKTSYVKIETVYNDRSELNLEFLSGQYKEPYLETKIRLLFGTYLDERFVNGKKILIKPNWVRHCLNESDRWCLCTNETLILAALKILVAWCPASIIVADAPIQGCDWGKLLSEYFLDRCKHYSETYNVPIIIKDFRKVIYNPSTNEIIKDDRSDSDYVIFDMGKNSYLEPVTESGRNRFRVTCYNPDEMAKTHRKGVHKYCIAKDVFDADIVLTMPKMKTHQKAGITNALKILVGVNGDKAFLPHHRVGSYGHGGDCYPGKNIIRSVSEWFLDNANRNIGKPLHALLSHTSALLWKLSNPSKEQNTAAGWYGNDTVWRMVMDINHIVRYGKKDGTISPDIQRPVYSLCDGIIAGQGNGPLQPKPLPLGILAFSNNSYWMDTVMGHLYSLDIERIAILRAAGKILEGENCELIINQKRASVKELESLAVDAEMAPGWVNYNK